MTNKFVLKNEALFTSLVSHALHCLEIPNLEELNPKAFNLARHVVTYFNKKGIKFNGKRALKISKYLREKIQPILEGKISPVIYLVITLDYLNREVRHFETIKFFNSHKTIITNLIDDLENSQHRELTLTHHKKLSTLV